MAPPCPARPLGSAIPPLLAWRCWGTALPAAPPPVPAARACRTGDADHALAQDAAPPDHAAPLLPVTGTRRRPQARALAPARASVRHQACRCQGQGSPREPCKPDGTHTAPASASRTTGRHGAARPPQRASPDAGPGTGWCCGDARGDTGRVTCGGHAWSAFPLGHARQQGCVQQPNIVVYGALPSSTASRALLPPQAV